MRIRTIILDTGSEIDVRSAEQHDHSMECDRPYMEFNFPDGVSFEIHFFDDKFAACNQIFKSKKNELFGWRYKTGEAKQPLGTVIKLIIDGPTFIHDIPISFGDD